MFLGPTNISNVWKELNSECTHLTVLVQSCGHTETSEDRMQCCSLILGPLHIHCRAISLSNNKQWDFKYGKNRGSIVFNQRFLHLLNFQLSILPLPSALMTYSGSVLLMLQPSGVLASMKNSQSAFLARTKSVYIVSASPSTARTQDTPQIAIESPLSKAPQ